MNNLRQKHNSRKRTHTQTNRKQTPELNTYDTKENKQNILETGSASVNPPTIPGNFKHTKRSKVQPHNNNKTFVKVSLTTLTNFYHCNFLSTHNENK